MTSGTDNRPLNGCKGLLYVASRITNKRKLSPEKFNDWYENTHIQEVTSLSGIPSAARYESVIHPTKPHGNQDGGTPITVEDSAHVKAVKDVVPWFGTKAREIPASWLTLYQMTDVGFRMSEEFRGLDGQSRPGEELLEEVFKNAEFQTRFYELVDVWEREDASGSAGEIRTVITFAVQSEEGHQSELEGLFKEKFSSALQSSKQLRRTSWYRPAVDPDGLMAASKLYEFVRSRDDDAPNLLAILELDGAVVDADSAEALKRLGDVGGARTLEASKWVEWGVWKLRREYKEG